MKRIFVATIAVILAAAGLLAALASAGSTHHPSISTVMSGLDAPRGLALGKSGELYVAESGRGAPCAGVNEVTIPPRNMVYCVGDSGAISRLDRHGHQKRVADGLPSLVSKVTVPSADVIGPMDVLAGRHGRLLATIGWGGTPSARTQPASNGKPFGYLVRIGRKGKVRRVVDVAAFEQANNPAGGPVDSNPFGLLADKGRYLADAGANSLYRIRHGNVSLVTPFPAITNPAGCFVPVPPPGFPAPPTSEPVPTTVVRGPDHALYVGGLGGFPFCAGAATIWRVVPGQAPTVHLTGFKMIIDMAFGRDKSLYVLQYATSPSLPGGPGELIKVSRNGTRTVIPTAGLLQQPGGIVIGHHGALYVSNRTISAGGGEVLRIVP